MSYHTFGLLWFAWIYSKPLLLDPLPTPLWGFPCSWRSLNHVLVLFDNRPRLALGASTSLCIYEGPLQLPCWKFHPCPNQLGRRIKLFQTLDFSLSCGRTFSKNFDSDLMHQMLSSANTCCDPPKLFVNQVGSTLSHLNFPSANLLTFTTTNTC